MKFSESKHLFSLSYQSDTHMTEQLNICFATNQFASGILWSPADPIVSSHCQTAPHS